MQELYDEGLAIHDGPESCAVFREGFNEALTGAHAGQAIEPRNLEDRGADVVRKMEGKTASNAIASCCWSPRGRRT